MTLWRQKGGNMGRRTEGMNGDAASVTVLGERADDNGAETIAGRGFLIMSATRLLSVNNYAAYREAR